jgi:uncharacterized protein YbjQ (UPF0145 family)
MLMTSTPGLEGRKIKRYCGLVTGDAIVGPAAFSKSFATLTETVGGKDAGYQGELKKARDIALKELNDAAITAGASALIGVRLEYQSLGGMLMVSAMGTAVLMEGELH